MGNGMLSQEEIDALLKGTLEPDTPTEEDTSEEFSEIEKDALGEIANISMGTAATTLSQLLGKKVEITTPKVDVTTSDQIRKDYPIPSVIVDVKYKAGIEGSNLLILSQRDGSVIVDMMMGGDGSNPSPELTELQISGISEAMNQMMGSAATSMSTMFSSTVDITPPKLVLNDLSAEEDVIKDFLLASEPLIRISFRMVVGTVIDSILVQVIPVSVAKGMVSKLLGGVQESHPIMQDSASSPPPQTMQPDLGAQSFAPETHESVSDIEKFQAPEPDKGSSFNDNYGQQDSFQSSQGSYNAQNYSQPHSTSVQPAQFAPLRPEQTVGKQDNLSLILDVPLQVSVELGRTRKTIKEILELGPGSVIELERLAGEPVDMIVNGKLIAKCEVVVINETFGIRITDIVQPIERMKTLN